MGRTPAVADDREDAALLVGTWKHPVNADVTFNRDGTFTAFLVSGSWKVSDGKLVQIYTVLGESKVDKSDFVVTRDRLVWVRSGMQQTYTRKR
jgi:hypothetical protein